MLSGAEFVLSPAGVLKVFSLLCKMIGGLIFITTVDCSNERIWAIVYIVVTVMSAALGLLSYCGYALVHNKSDKTIKVQSIAEITLSYTVFFLLLIVSIISMTQCNKQAPVIQKMPEPLTIIGAMLMAIGGTILFIQWRSSSVRVEEAQPDLTPTFTQSTANPVTRKSMIGDC